MEVNYKFESWKSEYPQSLVFDFLPLALLIRLLGRPLGLQGLLDLAQTLLLLGLLLLFELGVQINGEFVHIGHDHGVHRVHFPLGDAGIQLCRGRESESVRYSNRNLPITTLIFLIASSICL